MAEPQYRLEGIVHTKSEMMEDFEGPLDVILELLSKNKIEIQDVSITAILEQYLAYLEEMKRLDMEIASEFITMASHLMLIKTKMLLSAAEQAEAESELDLIRKSLMERKRKEAMEQIRLAILELEPRNEIGRNLFTKEPEPLKREKGYHYQHHVSDLLRALDMITERNARQLPPPTTNFQGIVGKEPYPIGKKTGEVLRQLVLRGVERLKNLFRGNKSRSEVVATFLAILDLCKTNAVTLEDDVNGENPNVRLLDETERKKGDGLNMEPEELQRAIEAILFASGERIDIQRFADVFELDPDEIEKAADALSNTYAYERRGMRILKLEKGYQMVSAGDMAEYITKALETRKPPKLSSSQLETLTIIAYYQPATKAMVEQIRGVDSAYSVAALMNKKLIEEAGRLNVPGRPIQYKTTPDFLRTFGLSSLEELPPIDKIAFGEPIELPEETKTEES